MKDFFGKPKTLPWEGRNVNFFNLLHWNEFMESSSERGFNPGGIQIGSRC